MDYSIPFCHTRVIIPLFIKRNSSPGHCFSLVVYSFNMKIYKSVKLQYLTIKHVNIFGLNGVPMIQTACVTFVVSSRRKKDKRNIISFLNNANYAYFGVKLGDQGKSWAPHKVYKTGILTFSLWMKGKKFPMVWQEPQNHLRDCCFCAVNSIGLTPKTRSSVHYPSLQCWSRVHKLRVLVQIRNF